MDPKTRNTKGRSEICSNQKPLAFAVHPMVASISLEPPFVILRKLDRIEL